MTFFRPCIQPSNSSRVITYINIHLSLLRFSLRNDILQHKDISCISFFNHGSIYFLINIYSGLSQAALKYLKNTEVNINNVLIMTGDFSIRDHFWNLNFPHYSSYRDIFFEIADSFQLEISELFEFFPTRYSDNPQFSNLFLDLVFLWPGSPKLNNHHIYPSWRLTSDHVPITVNISILKEQVHTKKQSLIKDSEEKFHFIDELIHFIMNINTVSLLYIEDLETVMQVLTYNIKRIWHKHSKAINITKWSKAWWDHKYYTDLEVYRQSRWLEDWKKFKNIIKRTKCKFFNRKIDEIANRKCGLWELIN